MAASPLPADFRRALWWRARWMPMVAKRAPLGRLLRRYTPAVEQRWTLDPDIVAVAAKAIVAKPRRMRGRRCLREGLLAYSFLRQCGHRPRLHFGVLPASLNTAKVRAHLWVSLNGRVLLNAPAAGYAEILTYDDTGDLPDGQVAGRLAAGLT